MTSKITIIDIFFCREILWKQYCTLKMAGYQRS